MKSSEGKGVKDFSGHNYFENDYDKNKELSDCCNAGVTINSGGEGTRYYVCDECHEPCDLKSWKSLDKKKTKKLDWEKEFDKEFNWFEEEDSGWVKSFISTLLSHQCQQTVNDTIEKIEDFIEKEKGFYDFYGYAIRIDLLLQQLETLKGEKK